MAREPAPAAAPDDEIAALERLTLAYRSIREQLAKIIVGQHGVVEQLLTALFCRGHCILEGVPGLAKTLMISTLSHMLSLSFSASSSRPT